GDGGAHRAAGQLSASVISLTHWSAASSGVIVPNSISDSIRWESSCMIEPPAGCGGGTAPCSSTVLTSSAAIWLSSSSNGETTARVSGLSGTPRVTRTSSAAAGSLRKQSTSIAAASGC